MDNETKRYRQSELSYLESNFEGYKPKIQIVSVCGKTKWLSIEEGELEQIKNILLGGSNEK